VDQGIEDGRKVKFIYQELPEDGAFITAQLEGNEIVYSVVFEEIRHAEMGYRDACKLRRQSWNLERRLSMLLLIIVLLLLFGGGDGYHAYSRWGDAGPGVVGTVLLIMVAL